MPPISGPAKKATIFINFTINAIGSIDEMEMTVDVIFTLLLKW